VGAAVAAVGLYPYICFLTVVVREASARERNVGLLLMGCIEGGGA
jgi:hypothetical protein